MVDYPITEEEAFYMLENMINDELDRAGVGKFNPMYNRKSMEAECIEKIYCGVHSLKDFLNQDPGMLRGIIRTTIEYRKSVNTKRKVVSLIIMGYVLTSIISFLMVPVMTLAFFRATVILGFLIVAISCSITMLKDH